MGKGTIAKTTIVTVPTYFLLVEVVKEDIFRSICYNVL
jgi:hypothetical protein